MFIKNIELRLGKYSFGTGDRFSLQGEAQLKALIMAQEKGIEISPVWNKSNREHTTIHSNPDQTRIAADNAVRNLGWDRPYFVDADHINMNNVERFVDPCDFFTIDVADYIGKPSTGEDAEIFVVQNMRFVGDLKIPGVDEMFEVSRELLYKIAEKYLFAIKQAGTIYRYLSGRKGSGNFIAEVSMDEVTEAQSPVELFFILSAISHEGVAARTIAPKFTGRFNKGVDYVGDIARFHREFEQYLLVIDMAVKEFGLPADLKLSVHSGSDKFSIYPAIRELITKHDKGIHLKTAGTTWLEEAIGLSLAGGNALRLVKDIYFESLHRFDELCGPYSTVIDIKRGNLPGADDVREWDGETLADSLRHIPDHPLYNPDFRQLLHVSYKIAAERGDIFIGLLKEHSELVGKQVTENIYDRHIKRLFNL
ncbi:MAG: hypothetical protein IH591_13315 [Bacteroidales bacterium]|nr:hypothetical protein [Bacteroidales bacterium]